MDRTNDDVASRDLRVGFTGMGLIVLAALIITVLA